MCLEKQAAESVRSIAKTDCLSVNAYMIDVSLSASLVNVCSGRQGREERYLSQRSCVTTN